MKDYSLTFYARQTNDKESGTLKLFGRVTMKKHRTDFSVNRYVKQEHWNKRSLTLRTKDPHVLEISKFISTIEEIFFKVEREMLERGIPVTPTSLIEGYRKVRDGKSISDVKSLLFAFDHHIVELEELRDAGSIHPKTVIRYHCTKKYIQEFLQARSHQEDIGLDKLEIGFVRDFFHFVHTKKANVINSTNKHIKRLRKVIRVARDNRWITEDPFVGYKQVETPVHRDYLTIEELRKLENLEISIQRLDRVRKFFLFSCYTGLAYIDMFGLTKENLQRDNNGGLWIITSRQKTKVACRIFLLPRAKQIMKEFENDPKAAYDGTLFPKFSNQHLNGYLKELAAMIGTHKHLTFHVARHTFATTVTLANGVSIETVSAQLGHTNIRETQHYAKMVNSRIGNEMRGLEGLFG